MNSLFYILLFVLVALIAFYGGIFVGIKDCKRRFNLPVGSCGVDDDGNICS